MTNSIAEIVAENETQQITINELVEALEKIHNIVNHYYGRQNEKLADIEPIARTALSKANHESHMAVREKLTAI